MMQRKMRTLFVSWILFGISSVASKDDMKMQDSFRRAVCSQNENMNVTCGDLLPTNKDNNRERSVWPPGPYALPMSVYGCPEGRSQGWSEGYLLLTFKDDNIVFTSKAKVQRRDTFDWPENDRFIIEPMSTGSIKINFCFKSRRNDTVDNGSFPTGNYSIYADESGCKEGFALAEQNMTLPEIEYWISDGDLPNFHIYEYENYATLTLSLCEMSVNRSPDAIATEEFQLFDTPFIFIQNMDNVCPHFGQDNLYLEEESIYLHRILSRNTTASNLVQSFCFNYPTTWKDANADELYETLMETGYILSLIQVTNGNTSVKPKDVQTALTASSSDLQLLEEIHEEQIYLPWKLINLGRTYDVSAVRLDIHFSTTVFSEATPTPYSFISNEKWSFLYSRALRCPFIPKYQTKEKIINIIFLRPMTGRYISLVGSAHDTFLRNVSSFDIFTQRIIYDDGEGCNIDIGMTDGAIHDFQINSSSSKKYFNHWEVRPYRLGWCAEEYDDNPFIMIDLLNPIRVEGVTIWNWKVTSVAKDNTAFEVIYKLGVKDFRITYAISLETFMPYSTIFRLEKYRENDEQITFWFLNSFIARYLKIHLMQPYSAGLQCLKFELHGCPGFSLVPTMYKSSADGTVVTNVKYVFGEGFISSPGFPEFYKSGLDLKWMIRSNSDKFLTLIFTHVSLSGDKSSRDTISCLDKILLSKHLVQGNTVRAIDYRLNNQVFMVETSETVLILSLITCLHVGKNEYDRTGFQVIVSHESTPSCFELDSSLSWETGRQEKCLMTPMNIKSMSLLGLPFVGTVEQWTVKFVRKRIKIYVKDFRVPCMRDGIGSELKIAESAYERTYCNLNRPPDVFYSQTDQVIVTFRKNEDQPNTRYTVGFRFKYYIKDVSLEDLIDFQAATSNLTNVAINKPAVMSKVDTNNPSHPSYGNDGDASSFVTGDYTSLDHWWMVDLEGVYKVEFMVLILRLQTKDDKAEERKRDLVIYTGFEEDSLSVTFFHCGSFKELETISFHKIHTRYIKIRKKYPFYETFRLTEVEVYGELGTFTKTNKNLVNTPRDQSGPSLYADSHMEEDLRSYHINRTKEKTKRFNLCPQPELANRDYSSWSTWTECSTKCGIGTRERRRHCILNNTALCFGEDTHLGKCVGNGSCPVCVYKFKKCYSFFAELTNWQRAGYECWRRYMTLVSIHSLEELQFIKYKLREKRHIDIPIKIQKTADKFNASFFVHIGLHKAKTTYSSNKFLWEDRSQIIFNAWKNGEPGSGSCVRMHYKYYEPASTWEASDCMEDLADYFVCERPVKNNQHDVSENSEVGRFPRYDSNWREIKEQIRTSKYKGTLNITSSGKECLPWTTYPSGQPPWFPEGADKERNFCRDPKHDGQLWCYVEGERYADSDNCNATMPEKEYPSFSVLTYTGTWARTFRGRQCKSWTKSSLYETTDFRGEHRISVSNFCRDPSNFGYEWCYTSDPNHPWEPCIVQDTSAKRCSDTIYKYAGFENITFSGKECQRWSMQNSFLAHENTKSKLSDEEILDAGVYCRDPFNDGYVWCYIGEAETDWEPCNISDKYRIDDMTSNSTTGTGAVFECGNGKLIPLGNKCDDKFDCKDLTDETMCWKNYTSHKLIQKKNVTSALPWYLETSSFFQCGSLEWVSILMKCDNVKDCADASDETGCLVDDLLECAEEEFRCSDGDCIQVSQVCNHVIDCVDSSDEYCDFGTCQSSEFRCHNGECLTLDKRCDGFVHCLDDSDEANCETCNVNKAFHCDIAKCIDKRLICDTYADCEDGSDESNCYNKGFTSCQDVWQAGYRETDIYLINGIEAECDFDSVLSRGRMYLKIMNTDIYWTSFSHPVYPEYSYRGYTYVRQGSEISDSNVEAIYRYTHLSCYVKSEQTCNPVYNAIMEFDENYYKEEFGLCSCNQPLVVECLFGCSRRSVCDDDPHTSEIRKYVTSYHNSILVTTDSRFTRYYEIISQPTKCSYTFRAETNVLACEDDVKIIPNHLRCVYDVDSTGIIIGCRSASHLKNCETFECPNDTVKCPGSYCIPIRFVCDGEMQCPGGQDEEDCGCIEEENEIVMLIHKEFLADNYATIHGFANQLSNDKNIVRLLSYETLTPLLDFGIESKLLKIYDQHIQAFSTVNRIEICQYNIMADRFLSTIKYSKNYPRGFIFFETDDDAAMVAKSLFSNKVHYNGLGYHLFRILEQPNYNSKVQTNYDQVIEISVPRWKVLTKIGGSFFPAFCKATSNTYCLNGYKCSSSKMCISLDQICDGQRQCPHGDDELLCDFTCPENCTCAGFAIDCRNDDIGMDVVETLPIQTRHLDISMNGNLSMILEGSYLNMKQLVRLNVSHCNVRNIFGAAFFKIFNLKVLDVSSNLLTVLRKNAFKVLVHLTSLYLHDSYDLITIEAGAFEGLVSVQGLQLVDSQLSKISAYTFSGLTLKYIDFSNNSITDIAEFAFDDLSVEKINFERNEIKHLSRNIFAGVQNLNELKTSAYKFCCVRPTYLLESDCYPRKDEFSSCEDLMRLSALQTMLWLVGISALIGNCFSIVYRLVYDRKRLKLGYGIFVTHLAVADFLMGIYLLIIAIADAVYRKRYIYMDDYWRGSGWCTLAGVLSTVSSEASVLFLCLITLDRLFVIKFPFGQIRFDTARAHFCSFVAWIVSGFIALLPVFYESYFQNKFYSKSGVCIALPLTRDRPPGWVYSVSVFVGLNFITFILVAFGQVSIFMEVKESSSRMRKMQSARRKDLTVARNLLLVVTTDFLCWFPIGVMGMMALSGHVISGDVYAWSAVFILPINSALNPILYTLSAIIGKTKFNPDTEEQTRTELSQELGNYIKEYQSISRQLSKRGAPRTKYRSIEEILERDVKVFATVTLKFTYELFRCLEVLHRAFLVVGKIDNNTICIEARNGKLIGNVIIKKDPVPTSKNEDLRNDILQTGKVINALINRCAKQKAEMQ